jgi:putative membrane protein
MMRHHFMYPYHWIILAIALVALILGIVYLVRRQSNRVSSGKSEFRDKTPLEILKERYARGEISRDDFERMKKDLE